MDLDHLDVTVTEKKVEGWGWVKHIRVCRADKRDGITWDELQAVKNEYAGPDEIAIEIYPRSVELVNEGNFRHLWVAPPGLCLPNLMRR